jgi:hypothetical protein
MMNEYYEMKTNEEYIDYGRAFGVSIKSHGNNKDFRKQCVSA